MKEKKDKWYRRLFHRDSRGDSSVSEKCYFSSSEYVGTGHPDRVADLLASIVISDIQKCDGLASHAAVEVFLTHDTVYFGGEVTTTLKIDKDYLKGVVKEGFNRAGYLPCMREHWTKKEVMLADDMKIVSKISAQSPDIALGTTDKGDESGWNDQGVYFSSCDNTNNLGIGYPHYVAKLISDFLHKESYESLVNGCHLNIGDVDKMVYLGPDNKCVVTVKVGEDGFTPLCVTAITIAVPHAGNITPSELKAWIVPKVVHMLRKEGVVVNSQCKIIVNGTGRFVVHGCVSDTSMTGRKISVNHPSAGPVWCNKMIGGGSLVKPAHASDLMLNVITRYISNIIVKSGLSTYAVVGCSGAIGVKGLQSIFIKGDDEFEASVDKERLYAFFHSFIEWSPKGIAHKFGFFTEGFDFSAVVKGNFFGDPFSQPWERDVLIHEDVQALKYYMSLK